MRIFVTALLILGMASLATAQNPAQNTESTGAPWDYMGKYGPVNWGKLDPAYKACSQGRAQSPIDIHDARLNKALKPIEFHYLGGPVTLVNNGHAIVGKVVPGSYILAGGVRYDLVDFTFHHPSEHEVDGSLSDMEVDLLHRSAEGKLLMIAVLMSARQDFPNATLASLWQHLPTKPGQSATDEEMVNPGGLFPSDPGYWTYAGSLPAPPCTEGVQWYVYQNSVNISHRQLDDFASIFKMNTRPVQELRGRRIEANE